MRPLPGRPGSPQYRQGGIYTILKYRERRERFRRQRLISQGICPECSGTGSGWIFKCSFCDGTGRTVRRFYI